MNLFIYTQVEQVLGATFVAYSLRVDSLFAIKFGDCVFLSHRDLALPNLCEIVFAYIKRVNVRQMVILYYKKE